MSMVAQAARRVPAIGNPFSSIRLWRTAPTSATRKVTRWLGDANATLARLLDASTTQGSAASHRRALRALARLSGDEAARPRNQAAPAPSSPFRFRVGSAPPRAARCASSTPGPAGTPREPGSPGGSASTSAPPGRRSGWRGPSARSLGSTRPSAAASRTDRSSRSEGAVRGPRRAPTWADGADGPPGDPVLASLAAHRDAGSCLTRIAWSSRRPR
jgi:hypothetical protein